MVKVIKYPEIREILCYKCKCTLEYSPEDISLELIRLPEGGTLFINPGEFYELEMNSITCPNCSSKIEVGNV